MATRRFTVSEVADAVFDDDFGLSGEESSDEESGEDLYAYLGEPIVTCGAIDTLTREVVDRANSRCSESDHNSPDSDLDSDYRPSEGGGTQLASLSTGAMTESEPERTDNSLAESPLVSDLETDSDSTGKHDNSDNIDMGSDSDYLLECERERG